MTHPFSTIAAIFAAFCLLMIGEGVANAQAVPVKPNPLAKMAWANKAKSVAVVPVAAPAPPANPSPYAVTPAPPAIPTGTASLGRSTLNWGPWTGINLMSVAKDSHGKPTLTGPSQGDGGLVLDFGFGQASDGNDRYHVALAGGFGGGAQNSQAFGSFTAGALLGWGGFEKWPLIAIGPAVNVPIASSLPPTFQVMVSMACLNFIKQLTQ